MKMEVKKEAAAFVLQGSSYNGCGEPVAVSNEKRRSGKDHRKPLSVAF